MKKHLLIGTAMVLLASTSVYAADDAAKSPPTLAPLAPVAAAPSSVPMAPALPASQPTAPNLPVTAPDTPAALAKDPVPSAPIPTPAPAAPVATTVVTPPATTAPAAAPVEAAATQAEPRKKGTHHKWTLEQARKAAHEKADKLDKMTEEEFEGKQARSRAWREKWKQMTPDEKAAYKKTHHGRHAKADAGAASSSLPAGGQ